jgi:hypothetical protein
VAVADEGFDLEQISEVGAAVESEVHTHSFR